MYKRQVTDRDAIGNMTGRVTIQCDARVGDDDLHTGWEQLYQNWLKKDPSILEMLKTRNAYPLLLERILIELTPRKTWHWPDGDTSGPPQVHIAAEVAR